MTAIVIYPLLHETGHSIATVFFGGKVVEFHLFPLPNVLCEVYSVSNIGIAIIGINGMVFPLLVAIILSKKTFALWYISELITGITLFAFLISTIALIINKFGIKMLNEDIITVVESIPQSETFLFPTTIILMIFSLRLFICNNPIKRLLEYLDIKNSRIA